MHFLEQLYKIYVLKRVRLILIFNARGFLIPSNMLNLLLRLLDLQ